MSTEKSAAQTPLSNTLIWIDLEMSGLNPASDVILEIAVIATDNNLTPLDSGLTFIIHQPDDILTTMNPWCQKQHAQSGLTEASRRSTITLAQAELQTREYIEQRCTPQSTPLCGNSISNDKNFLMRWMPSICRYLHYRIIDVSTVKELARRWYPNNPAANFTKPETHRALADIHASIAELQHYREHFFIAVP